MFTKEWNKRTNERTNKRARGVWIHLLSLVMFILRWMWIACDYTQQQKTDTASCVCCVQVRKKGCSCWMEFLYGTERVFLLKVSFLRPIATKVKDAPRSWFSVSISIFLSVCASLSLSLPLILSFQFFCSACGKFNTFNPEDCSASQFTLHPFCSTFFCVFFSLSSLPRDSFSLHFYNAFKTIVHFTLSFNQAFSFASFFSYSLSHADSRRFLAFALFHSQFLVSYRKIIERIDALNAHIDRGEKNAPNSRLERK